jgi:putative ABC transport system permease protein
MFKNYLKIAIRNLLKYKSYSFINIIGLAVGIACSIIIILWVRNELSYDRFHEKTDLLYRVIRKTFVNNQNVVESITSEPLANGLKNDFPEIVSATSFSLEEDILFKYMPQHKEGNEKVFIENKVGFAHPEILEMFSFPFIKGDPKTALIEPYSIVMSETMANKYFGESDPVGKIINIYNRYNFQVTGVMKDIPHNSHLKFDFLIPFQILNQVKDFGKAGAFGNWGFSCFYTYVLLKSNITIPELEKKIIDYMNKQGHRSKLLLQPIKRIHLYTDFPDYIDNHGNINRVYIFSILAFLVLFVACINFMSLSTARSATRSKEVCQRKVVGASRLQLAQQFFGEFIIFAVIAFLCALIIVELFLPSLNLVLGKQLKIGSRWQILLEFMAIVIVTGLIAGSYPAIYLSSFNPIKIIKGSFKLSSQRSKFRKILVILQFSITIVLLISTFILSNQINFMKNKKLGYTKDNVIYIPVVGRGFNYESLKNELLQNPNVLDVTTTSQLITDINMSTGDMEWEGKENDKNINMGLICTDLDFIKTFNIEIVQGRSFSKQLATDEKEAFIINEEAAKLMGMENPIGKRFSLWGRNGEIIGVAENFHIQSIHYKIEPLVIGIYPFMRNIINIRIESEQVSRSVADIKTVYEKFIPDYPFQYHFLDQNYERLYQAEERMEKLFYYFAGLTVLISCLGLFGLASYSAEQYTKEIGIRKVLGASIPNILFILTSDFMKWVMLSNVIAWPIAWYAMNKWLQNFAYRISIQWWMFALAGGITLIIALFTVSWQAIRAATANPVEALRYE